MRNRLNVKTFLGALIVALGVQASSAFAAVDAKMVDAVALLKNAAVAARTAAGNGTVSPTAAQRALVQLYGEKTAALTFWNTTGKELFASFVADTGTTPLTDLQIASLKSTVVTKDWTPAEFFAAAKNNPTLNPDSLSVAVTSARSKSQVGEVAANTLLALPKARSAEEVNAATAETNKKFKALSVVTEAGKKVISTCADSTTAVCQSVQSVAINLFAAAKTAKERLFAEEYLAHEEILPTTGVKGHIAAVATSAAFAKEVITTKLGAAADRADLLLDRATEKLKSPLEGAVKMCFLFGKPDLVPGM